MVPAWSHKPNDAGSNPAPASKTIDNMTSGQFSIYMDGYLKAINMYHKSQPLGWEIRMTTKRRPKASYSDPDGNNGYRLYIYDMVDKKDIFESEELKSFSRSSWDKRERMKFIKSLKEIIAW